MLTICYHNLVRHERQTNAINQIFDAFETHGISYMPVKGCNIKHIYPKPELRGMGDVDILIRANEHDRIYPVMEELGFCFRIENDHVYEWHSDNLHVELHKSLVPPGDEDYYSYYCSGWQFAQKSGGYRYDLSAEAAYIFMLAHFARHYRKGGIGCRHVVDLFVYRNEYPNLNMKYIMEELDKLHLRKFHENVIRMLNVWFLGIESDVISELITSFVFSGGNWGTSEAYVFSMELKKAREAGKIKNSKIKSVIHSLFPSAEELSYRYVMVRKCPLLLPMVWVVRWIDILLFRPERIRNKWNILDNLDDEGILNRKHALQAVGLDFWNSD